MIRYLGLKLGTAILALWGVASLVFFLFTVLPGDPAQMMLDQNEDREQLEVIKSKFGFDLPLTTQYLYYLNDLLPISIHSKDSSAFGSYNRETYGGWILFTTQAKVWVMKPPYFRTSFQKRGKPIAEIIKETLPNTALLAFSSICLAVFFGCFSGRSGHVKQKHLVGSAFAID